MPLGDLLTALMTERPVTCIMVACALAVASITAAKIVCEDVAHRIRLRRFTRRLRSPFGEPKPTPADRMAGYRMAGYMRRAR